jgi:WD40 repeat protein
VIGSLAAGLLLVTGLAVWGAVSARSARRQEERARDARAVAEEQQAEADAQRAEADTQRAEADARRAEAEALAISSRSRQLAADSVTQLDRNLDRAMLLAVQAYRTEPTLQARSALVSALEFSPRLTGYVAADSNEVVPQSYVAFGGADGNEVAAVGVDGMLRRFDADSGELVAAPVDLVHDPLSPTLAFSDDGQLLAIENCLANPGDSRCEIHLWDVSAGRERGRIVARGSYVSKMAFSSDDRLLAIVDYGLSGTAVEVWDLAAGTWVGEPIVTQARSVAFSPDSRTLATGLEPESNATGESSVTLWDVATQRLLAATPVYNAGGVNALDFSPDGRQLAAGHGLGAVAVFNVADLTTVGEPFEAPSGVLDVAFSPDGSGLATTSAADDHVLLWTSGTQEPERLSGHGGEVYAIDFDAAGTRLASAGVDGRVYFWQVAGHHALRRAAVNANANGVSALVFAGDEVFSMSPAGPRLGSRQISTWNPETSDLARVRVRTNGVVALSPDGRVAAVGDGAGSVRRFDTRTGAEIAPSIAAHPGEVTAIAFGGDGRTLVSAGCHERDAEGFSCEDAEVAVLDLAGGRRVAGGVLEDESFVDRVALSPDGATLAVAGASWKVSLWDVAHERTLPGQLDAGDSITDVAWSPNGSLLAVASEFGGAHAPGASGALNNKVVVWDVAARNPVGEPLLGGASGMSAATFSPDGSILAAGDFSGAIRLWDAETLSTLGDRIVTGSSNVAALRFSPDGRTLASGHGNGQVQLWDTDPEAWIDHLCAAANRNLTDAEWAEFVGDVEYEATCPEASG